MQVSIHDRDALLAISPAALSAYARVAGWRHSESYRKHADVYVGDKLPEIIVPRTTRLGDYANVVSALIKTFAQVANQSELTVYGALTTAERDEIRIQVPASDDGSLRLNDGVSLLEGIRDLVLSAAHSLQGSQPVHQAGANKDATELLRQLRLRQSACGHHVVTLSAIPAKSAGSVTTGVSGGVKKNCSQTFH